MSGNTLIQPAIIRNRLFHLCQTAQKAFANPFDMTLSSQIVRRKKITESEAGTQNTGTQNNGICPDVMKSSQLFPVLYGWSKTNKMLDIATLKW